METRDNHFHPKSVDADIEQFLWEDADEVNTEHSRAHFVRALSGLYLQESEVLDRVWERLSHEMQPPKQPPVTRQSQWYQKARREPVPRMPDLSIPGRKNVVASKHLSGFGTGLVALLLVVSTVLIFLQYQQTRSGFSSLQQHLASFNQTVQQMTATLADARPPVGGPAASNVLDILLAARINPVTKQPATRTAAFTFRAGQEFWLTFSTQSSSTVPIQITIMWYQNSRSYLQQTQTLRGNATRAQENALQVQYNHPGAGKVEVYWQRILAWTLYFTVE